jgi:hypothetical protein
MLPISRARPVAGIVARRILALAGLLEFPKAFHETVRAALRLVRISVSSWRARMARLTLPDPASWARLSSWHRPLPRPASHRAHLIERLTGIDQFIPLRWACLAPGILGVEDLANGMGMADERHSAGVAQGILRVIPASCATASISCFILCRSSPSGPCTVTEFAHAEDDVADPVNGIARHTRSTRHHGRGR